MDLLRRPLRHHEGVQGQPAVSGADTLAYLLGGWSVDRVLVAPGSGYRGTFTGEAEFCPEPGGTGAAYHEQGRLRWPTYDGPASRRLRYALTGDGALTVRFADGRPFHILELRGGRASYVHPCGDDVYIGILTVVDEDEWRQVWRVAAEQELEIRTRFRRRCA